MMKSVVYDRKQQLLELLETLRKKESDLSSRIQAVDAEFLDMGFRIDASKGLVTKEKEPQNGIRIDGKLSFRGMEKAAEHFDRIDVDRDGYMSFEDMRSIRGFGYNLGSPSLSAYESWEAWKLHMEDIGLRPTLSGGINKQQYVKYRAMIELQQPIAEELHHLGMGWLPPHQKQWALCKKLLLDHIAFRESRLPPTELGVSDESFNLEELSYVLNVAGYGVTKYEIFIWMTDRVKKKHVMNELLRTYARSNLGEATFSFALDGKGRLLVHMKEEEKLLRVAEIETVQRMEILPWMAAWPMLVDPSDMIYRQLLLYKYKFISWVRSVEGITRSMYHFAAHINDRLVFRDFVPLTKATNSKSLLDVCTLKIGLSIGDDNRRDGGLSGSFKLIKVDNPSQMFKQLKLSPDSGSALLIDLLYREKISSKDMDRCVTLLRQFLVSHIERELRGNRMFSGMTVCNAINEQDNSKVLRVIFCYKRMVSLDGWLEQMLIPYTVADLIPILMGDFRTNLDFAEIIKSKLATFSSHFSGSVDCSIGFKRNTLMTLLERLSLAMSAGLTADQVEYLNSRSTGKKKVVTEQLSVQEEDRRRRLWRWHLLYPYFPFIRQHCDTLYASLLCMKSASFKMVYSSIGEFFYKLGLSNFSIRRYFPSSDFFFQVGKVRQAYEDFKEKYLKEFNGIFDKLKAYLESKKEEEYVRRIKQLIGKDSNNQGNEKSTLDLAAIDNLRRLGIDAADAADLDDHEPTPEEQAGYVLEGLNKQEIANFIAVETFRQHLVGIHSSDVYIGKAKISMTIQGLDVFELLPELPSMLKAQQDNAVKPTRSHPVH